MGSGASIDIKHQVKELVEGKPDDATDIKDLAVAQKEIARFRKIAGEILSGYAFFFFFIIHELASKHNFNM